MHSLKSLRALAGACLLASLALPAGAAIVSQNGYQWQQPADFTNLSWNAIAVVCPSGSFVCSGTLNGMDLTGWTFASQQAVWDLFVSYGVPDTPFSATEDSAVTPSWYTAFMAEFEFTGFSTVQGWTSTNDATNSTRAYRPYITSGGSSYLAVANISSSKDSSNSVRGAWFSRAEPAEVPVPGTALLLAPLAGLIAFRRRRAA